MQEKDNTLKIKLILDTEEFMQNLKAVERNLDPILKKIETINSNSGLSKDEPSKKTMKNRL